MRRRASQPCKRPRSKRLHRRIFAWFGFSIAITFGVVGALAGRPFSHRSEPLRHFAATQFAAVWSDPPARNKLAREVSKALNVRVSLSDPSGTPLMSTGRPCGRFSFVVRPRRSSGEQGPTELGTVRFCGGVLHSKVEFLAAFLVAGLLLWGASGVIAHRLVRPLSRVAEVARDIGGGNLASRVTFRRRKPPGELGELVDAINDMAARIQKQMEDQRALLAAVSHEIRTPLGHMKVISELAREGQVEKLRDLEQEISDVDALVDQLLASSRLEFETVDRRPLHVVDLCARALERAQLDAGSLDISLEQTELVGDPMLLGRAIGNLLENAKRHATRIRSLKVTGDAYRIQVTVEDEGPGFGSEELDHVFDDFYRGTHRAKSAHSSLGLGLALVRRIAEAHGGSAWAHNTAQGAEVGFEVARNQHEEVNDEKIA